MKSEDQYNSEVFEFYRLLEKKMLQESETSFSKSIYNITLINDKNFKILKAYSPLQIIYQTNYFYPIYNIKLHLILINEESINELLSNLQDLGKSITYRFFIFAFSCYYLHNSCYYNVSIYPKRVEKTREKNEHIK